MPDLLTVKFGKILDEEHQIGFRSQGHFKRDPGAYFQYDALILLDAVLRSTLGDSSPEALASSMPGMTFDGVRGRLTIDAMTHGTTQTMYAVETVLDGDRVGTRVSTQLGSFSPTAEVQ